jgi:hypothetical protein
VPASYPPVLFKKTRLRHLIKDRTQADPQTWLIQNLNVSNVTAARILNGCDLRFSRAIKIAKLLDLEIDHIWGL